MTDQLITDETVERLCEVMHDAYEAAAVEKGWETQAASRKPWADVPGANKATMRISVRALLAAAAPYLRPAIAEEIAQAIEAKQEPYHSELTLSALMLGAAVARRVGAAHPDATTHPNTEETPHG